MTGVPVCVVWTPGTLGGWGWSAPGLRNGEPGGGVGLMRPGLPTVPAGGNGKPPILLRGTWMVPQRTTWLGFFWGSTTTLPSLSYGTGTDVSAPCSPGVA